MSMVASIDWGGILAFAVVGGLLGAGCAAGIAHLLRAIEAGWGVPASGSRVPSIVVRRGFVVVAIVAAAAIFGWEVIVRGLEPAASPMAVQDGPPVIATWARAAAHLVLFCFMAAAVWCDYEYRVIPDAITAPGALLGMVCVTLFPSLLLPIGWETPRDFAAPLITPDVLGALGPLRATIDSPWLGPLPEAAGLAAVVAAFVAWWLVCTAPAVARTSVRDPRAWLLPVGIVSVTVVWAAAGWDEPMRLHYRAMQTSLLGAAVSGGIVWLFRAAASRAVGREAMGLGDVTLMAMVGTWCGWQHGMLTFFVGAFLGLAQGLVTWLRHRENELPYGPSLCLAGAAVVLGWRSVWSLVGPFFDDPILLFGALAAVIVLTAISLAVWIRLRA